MKGKSSPENSLLLAEFSETEFANAFIFLNWIVTAGHVAAGISQVTSPNGRESARVQFQHIPGKDLAFSLERTPFRGIHELGFPHIGEQVTVHGHHGPQKKAFAIPAQVADILENGRIVIQRLHGKKFQLGMSGSPVFTKDGAVIGILVEEVDDTGGDQVLLEPLVIPQIR